MSVTQECKCGKVQFELTDQPKLHAACFCNGCRLSGEYIVSLGGDSPLDAVGSLPEAFFLHSDVKLIKGKEDIQAFVVIAGSKTRRFYCKSCKTKLAIAPEGFPMIGLPTKTLKSNGGTWPPLEARHSLEQVENKDKHDELVKACQNDGNVPWFEKQYAPCLPFLCPVICAKICCSTSTIPEITDVDYLTISEVAVPGAKDCNDSMIINLIGPETISR